MEIQAREAETDRYIFIILTVAQQLYRVWVSVKRGNVFCWAPCENLSNERENASICQRLYVVWLCEVGGADKRGGFLSEQLTDNIQDPY